MGVCKGTLQYVWICCVIFSLIYFGMLRCTCDISWDIPSMGYILGYTSYSYCPRKPKSLRNQHFQNAARGPGPGPCAPHFENVDFEEK